MLKLVKIKKKYKQNIKLIFILHHQALCCPSWGPLRVSFYLLEMNKKILIYIHENKFPSCPGIK
jgi:hypothetical protein